MGWEIKTQVKLRKKMNCLNTWSRTSTFVNKEKVVVVVGVTWGLQLCVHVCLCMCVYKGVNLGKGRLGKGGMRSRRCREKFKSFHRIQQKTKNRPCIIFFHVT